MSKLECAGLDLTITIVKKGENMVEKKLSNFILNKTSFNITIDTFCLRKYKLKLSNFSCKTRRRRLHRSRQGSSTKQTPVRNVLCFGWWPSQYSDYAQAEMWRFLGKKFFSNELTIIHFFNRITKNFSQTEHNVPVPETSPSRRLRTRRLEMHRIPSSGANRRNPHPQRRILSNTLRCPPWH